MNSIRVITFCGKVEEWPNWSERFLVKAKYCGFKDLLLGKFSIHIGNILYVQAN
jgi:hypothetical protein